jgi:riboflavin biosynthesis pyrimidine reductase
MSGRDGVIATLPRTTAGLHPWYGDPPDGVRANIVLSLDGGAAFDGKTRPISDDTDLWLLNQLRGYADVVMVGAGTVRAERYGPVRLDPEQRTHRREAGYGEDPPPFAVVSARAHLERDLPVFNGRGTRPLLVTVERSRERAEQLADLADVVIAGDERVDPVAMLAALRDRGLRRILCEGGPTLLASLIEHDLVDDMCLSLAPRFAGPQVVDAVGRPAQPLEETARLAQPITMPLHHVLENDGMLYLRYFRSNGGSATDGRR